MGRSRTRALLGTPSLRHHNMPGVSLRVMKTCFTFVACFVLCVVSVGCQNKSSLQPTVTLTAVQTVDGVGAAQGVEVIDGTIYIYGDDNTGVIRQYNLNSSASRLDFAGLEIRTTENGNDVASHPTGLTKHQPLGTFMGDTVNRQGVIFHIDFEKLRAGRTLDGAILNRVRDDAAVNGTRPEFVRVKLPGDAAPRWLIATSDYGDVNNQIRLYDPVKLQTAKNTSEPGVMLARFPCGSFVQNLSWIDERGVLVLVQNITPGLGWRLTFLDLQQSVDRGEAVILSRVDLSPADELEGFEMLGADTAIMVSAMQENNVRFAKLQWVK
jgi:hypothetical protein